MTTLLCGTKADIISQWTGMLKEFSCTTQLVIFLTVKLLPFPFVICGSNEYIAEEIIINDLQDNC